jgi:hypothetical protein
VLAANRVRHLARLCAGDDPPPAHARFARLALHGRIRVGSRTSNAVLGRRIEQVPDFTRRPDGSSPTQKTTGAAEPLAPGKRTLTEQLVPHAPVQRSPARPASGGATGTGAAAHEPHVAPPEAGIDKPGFVDNSKGAPIYNAPAEAGGELLRDAPLPPAARVFASGTHPRLKHWWYVTAFTGQTMLRGYVEDFRINVQLPEPLAELRQLMGGETPEGLAKEKYGQEVRDGHDLRYYENVLLYVNKGRDGISGTYQDPNVLGGGSNNIKLFKGHRIWLVSPEYAKALESVVPSGSLTGGAVAQVKRFAGHFQDILQSVTESRNHFGEVAGEFAQAIRDHLPAIVGITAGFLAAEAGSMFLAATPIGVGQAAAAVIQLALSAFGAAGMIEGGIEALKHGGAWLTTAWTANGKPELIVEASKEFLRMLVAVAVAALAYVGAKGNYRNALKIANNMPTGGLPAFATAGAPAGAGGGPAAGTGAAIGPSAGGPAFVGAAAVGLSDKEKAALGEGPEVAAMGERDTGKARSRELHERRAADGRKSPDAKEGHGPEEISPSQEKRTEKAKHIPPRGDAFNEWFDSLTLAELDELLADESKNGLRGARAIIDENIRHPGNLHEWLKVGEVRQFKKWGVPMRTIKEGRTLTKATIGKRFRHGGAGSGTMHLELAAMVQSSSSYPEFLMKLNLWADREFVASHSARWPDAAPLGRYSLPDNLQLRGQ